MTSAIGRGLKQVVANLNARHEFKLAARGTITLDDAKALISKVQKSGLSVAEATAFKKEIAKFESRMTPEAREEFYGFLFTAPYRVKGTSGWAPKSSAAQPSLVARESSLSPGKQRQVSGSAIKDGQLFIDGVDGNDPMQRDVGDCFLVSSMSSVVRLMPTTIREAFQDNHDGTWNVRVFEKQDKKLVPVWVKVDGTVAKDVYGQAWYTHSTNSKELWPALLEKALATRAEGGYATLDKGGVMARAMESLTGISSKTYLAKNYSGDEMFALLKKGQEKGLPLGAAMRKDRTPDELSKVGIVADHAYSVVGVSEANGEKFVTLRNPWAWFEPKGNGPDDGVFTLTLAQFTDYCHDFAICGGSKVEKALQEQALREQPEEQVVDAALLETREQ